MSNNQGQVIQIANKLQQEESAKSVANSVFSNAIQLEKKVAIYVPSTVDVTTQIDSKPIVDKTMQFLSELFGGATSVKSQGAWMSEKEGLVIEGVTVVYAYTSDFTHENLQKVKNYAEHLKLLMSQEGISVEVDTQLFIV